MINKTEKIFTDTMHNYHKTLGIESLSGHGSSKKQTRVIVKEIPILFKKHGITSILDLPCGDFNWMQDVDLTGITYTGGDIVKEVVSGNKQYETKDIKFININLLIDKLPITDVILCRDCLVHLSHSDLLSAIRNIKRSGIKYLLTTTFPDKTENKNIETGEWRHLNLVKPPFNFPPPVDIILEGCSEGEQHKHKSLGLWEVDSI